MKVFGIGQKTVARANWLWSWGKILQHWLVWFLPCYFFLAMITDNPVFDAIGSIGIGVLLVIISIFLTVKVQGLLIGQSVEDNIEMDIKSFIEKQDGIDQVLNLITVQLGAQIMVAVKVKMKEQGNVAQLIAQINACEKALKEYNHAIQWIFFEPDVAK